MTIRVSRLLAAVDGSRASLQAGRWAIETAQTVSGTVHVVSVHVDAAHQVPPTGDAASVQRRLVEGMERALRYLERYAAERAVPLEHTLVSETTQPAFEIILSVASSWQADLIFIGRTSRAGPGRVFLGSQTEHVLEFSVVPVVVVPDPSNQGGTSRVRTPAPRSPR
jgi:nucleotide-binding universal stress UspA family protein